MGALRGSFVSESENYHNDASFESTRIECRTEREPNANRTRIERRIKR
jgi:hypothetical protein